MRFLIPTVAAVLLSSAAARAQDSSAQVTPRAVVELSASVSVPEGTRLLTQLAEPIRTRSAKAGDSVYLETTFPISGANEILIPAGTGVLATLDKLKSHWSDPPRVELDLHMTQLLYANGYIATAAAPAHATSSSDAWLRPDRQGTEGPAAIGTALGLGGAAIGSAANGRQGAAVGSVIGGLVGTAVAAFSALRSRGMSLEAGLPLEIVLQGPIALDEQRAAAPAPPSHLARAEPLPPPRHERCFHPGTPGTADLIIPGAPGTPPTADSPGAPPTPPTIIPGTPGTLGYWDDCP
jgi:hypothetical protein